MAKWKLPNEGFWRIAARGDRAGGPTDLSPQAVSTEGAHPLRVRRLRKLLDAGTIGLRVEEDPLSPIPFHVVEVVFDARDDADELFEMLTGRG